jgi:hypothetical protein
VGDPVGEFAIIGEEQQPFAFLVQTTHWGNASGSAGHQIDGSDASCRIRVSTDHTFGFVQSVVHQPADLGPGTIDGDHLLIAVHFGAKLRDHLTVDLDVAGANQFLAGSPRSQAAARQELL